jgi:hypothetical protein
MKLFGTPSLSDNRPHPQERENGFTVTGNIGCAWFATFPRTKGNKGEPTRAATNVQAGTDSCSLSPGERVRVRASVSTN